MYLKKILIIFLSFIIFMMSICIINEQLLINKNKKIVNNFMNCCSGIYKKDNLIKGIELNKKIKEKEFKEGDIVYQYQIPTNLEMGRFFFIDKSIKPTYLGISGKGFDYYTNKIYKKELKKYRVIISTNMLESYAKDIEDTWSIPNKKIKTKGGEKQYFSCCKMCFERIE